MKFVDMRIVDDDLERQVQLIEVARQHTLPEMKDQPTSRFGVSVLSGGITNQLYRVVLRGSEPSDAVECSVVVRVFGKETERIISRESELFYQSYFLPTFCQGINFLAYKFLDGYKDIEFLDMPTLRREIAAELANFHWIATAAAKGDVNDEGTRFAREKNAIVSNLSVWSDQAFTPAVWEKLSQDKKETLLAANLSAEAVTNEIHNVLLPLLHRLEETLVCGVCHNDLLCANIMRFQEDASSTPLQFIDFEYSKRNFVLYDFANHFNEYVGLECKYDELFPSNEIILDSMLAYRQRMRELIESRHPNAINDCPFTPEEASQFFTLTVEEERRVAETWTRRVLLLSLASNLMWCVWAVLQAAHSCIDFDFAWYAVQRWRRYLATRDKFLEDS